MQIVWKSPWRRFDGHWWYYDDKETEEAKRWKRLTDADETLPMQPPRAWGERVSQSLDSASPLPPLLIGATAALVALAIAAAFSSPATVLAPVLTAIGAFAGHAAGHAAARQTK